jgi:hypothetical protein
MRVVVFHSKGPKFDQRDKLPPDQSIKGHVQHYKKLLEAKKLAIGGPFPTQAGGMMICKPGVKKDEIEKFANDDPAVKSGVLKAETREWLVILQDK